MRRWLTRLLWLGWAGLVLLLIAAHFIGQRSLWTTLLVYVPVAWWCAALLLHAVLAVRVDWRLSLISVFTLLVVSGPLWEFRTHQPPMPVEAMNCLRVLTCNRGQHHGHTLEAFIAEQQPDVIALQESNERGSFLPAAPEYAAYPHRSRISEFQILSKLPIANARMCVLQRQRANGTSQSWFKLARFELQTSGGLVVLYNAHMLSPRFELRTYLQARITDEAERKRTEEFKQEQEALLMALMDQVESESLPTILCGDLNVPSLGPLYRRLTRTFRDSQSYGGAGYGFTFPGDVKLPLTGGQWLRLDYVLVNRDWDILRCDVEQQMGAQHSAVTATLHLRP